MTEVTVLGAGPAGLAAAMELARSGIKVTVIEAQHHVGGNAASFDFGGIQVDYGSHRLHPAANYQVLNRIRELLGDDLLTRPRHGRIRLMGRWIHFPLRPVDLALRMNPRFSIGVGLDLIKKIVPVQAVDADDETFASILKQGLGNTICREFYFPYARKIWGLEPGELSPIQARKRVSAGSIGKMLKRLLPGSGSGGANTKGIFYYPKYGFGQISQALQQAAKDAGAEIILAARICEIKLDKNSRYITLENDKGEIRQITADQIFSTIPVTALTRLIAPAAPDEVMTAANQLEFRAMILVYLQLDQDQFTEFDAHYFPGSDYPFTRVSEPKNYSASAEPKGRTVLCAEIPCFRDDVIWSMSETELADLVSAGLTSAGLPIKSSVTAIQTRRIPFAYPLYRAGYEQQFSLVDAWVDGLDGIVSFGRQGLYAHDNTHHAIYMAQAAAKCLREDGTIDVQAWAAERKIFATHIVED